MKKFYEKPIAELIDFEIKDDILDLGNYSEGDEVVDPGEEEL